MSQEITIQETALSEAHSTEVHDEVEICSNCNSKMHGAYCAKCGQATRHFIKFFPSVAREIVEDTFDVDGRFGRTVWSLLAKPGRLTSAFLNGKRIHYSPPFRLYLVTSLIAFLVFSYSVSYQTIVVVNTDDDNALTEAFEDVADDIQDEREDLEEDEEEQDFINFDQNGKPWHYQDNPVVIDWLPPVANQSINTNLHSIQENMPRIIEQPSLLMKETLSIMPTVLFILLPIYALILKLLYLFKRRYYMEHLIYSLHIHTATLFIFMLVTALNVISESVATNWQMAFKIPNIILILWYFVYLFLAQKHVYQQGWIISSVKFFILGSIYSIFLLIAQLISIIIGAASI